MSMIHVGAATAAAPAAPVRGGSRSCVDQRQAPRHIVGESHPPVGAQTVHHADPDRLAVLEATLRERRALERDGK